MVEWSATSNMPLHILLTKCDKLTFGAAKGVMQKLSHQLRGHGDLITIQLFSSLKKTGVDELSVQLDHWLCQEDAEDESVNDAIDENTEGGLTPEDNIQE